MKKGGNLPPMSKYPPEKLYMKVLRSYELRKYEQIKKKKKMLNIVKNQEANVK